MGRKIAIWSIAFVILFFSLFFLSRNLWGENPEQISSAEEEYVQKRKKTDLKEQIEIELKFEKSSIHLLKGGWTDCPAYVKKSGVKLEKPKLIYSSNDQQMIKVDKESGKILARDIGQCTVTCTYEENGRKISKSIPVMVKKKLTEFSPSYDYIGHRGNVDRYPENTIAAFESSLNRGCVGIECDVHYTKSGALLICHDENLERICGIERSIYDMMSSDKKKYPLYSQDGELYYIPSLWEVLEKMSEKKAFVYIHLKGDKNFSEKGLDEVYKYIKRYNMMSSTVVFCQNRKVLEYLNKYNLNLCCFLKNDASLKENLKWCHDHSIQRIFVSKIRNLDADLIDLCKEYGIKIGVYWLKNKNDILNGMDYGIDFGLLTHDDVGEEE